MRQQTHKWIMTVAISLASLVSIAVAVVLVRQQWRAREPRFSDDFVRDSSVAPGSRGWEAFGGTWQMRDGAMQNVSDDRGAKLVNGSPSWRDYTIEADVQLLSETGDAGFVFRTNSEEIGVDAYHGYFAGLRDRDDTLILGRADFGWHEFQSVPVHSRVHTRTWYHLKVMAYGCDVAASAKTPEGETTLTAIHDENCIQKGRFGLQSYSTGAKWRNLTVRPASYEDLVAMLGGVKPGTPAAAPLDAQGLAADPGLTNLADYQRTFAPMLRELQNNHADLSATPIARLRLLAPNISPHVTVHGVVTLVSPQLFIQDSSGGIAVPAAHPVVPVQIGDAVEASGDAEFHSFSSVLRNATVRLLWSHTQVPAVAVTAAQAASGGFDAQFVETEGRLIAMRAAGAHSLVLQLDEGSQSFLALLERGSNPAVMPALRIGSRLRLRGICVTDQSFTKDEVPFALLMRSGGDVQVLAAPPWWSKTHVAELSAALLLVIVGIQVLYASIQRSRLHAVMDERERLAMEMHDTLAQSFAGLGYQLEGLCEEAQLGSSLRTQLEATLGLVRFGHMQARRNISALRPANLEQLGLAGALEQAAQRIVQGGHVSIQVITRGEQRGIPLRISDPLFRIGQEAIANSVRHGRPKSIRIRLRFGKDSLRLSVHDDGAGFHLDSDRDGFGLHDMQERAERIGGSFQVCSSPGRGTLVLVGAPLSRRLFSHLNPVTRSLKVRYSQTHEVTS